MPRSNRFCNLAESKTCHQRACFHTLQVELYEKLRGKFSVDDYRHYLFNPRDLTQVRVNAIAVI